MTTTEMMPPRHLAMNRIRDVYKQLERSKPLADRLAKDNTAGLTRYSDEPRSTWGFNPFSPPQEPADKQFSCGSYFAQVATHIIVHKCLDVLTQINNQPWPIRVKTYWCNQPQESQHRISTSGGYDLWTGYINCGLWTSLAEKTDAIPARLEQPEPVVQVNMADFLDPLDFGWTDSDTQAAKAARSFNEHVYADH